MSSHVESAERIRRTALAVLAVCFLFNMLGRGLGEIYSVFLLPLEREFGWTRAQLTSVYSLYLLVNALIAPLVGLAFDRLGPRWVYGAGIACMGTAFALAWRMDSLWQFYVLIGGVVGVAVALLGMVPASALLARWIRTRLATAIGVAFSAVGVGTIAFVPLTQVLVEREGWRPAYGVLGGVLLVLTPILMFALPWRRYAAGDPEHRAQAVAQRTAAGWTLRAALRTPIYWGMVGALFCTAAGMFSVTVQLVAFLIDAGYSPLLAASAYGAIGMLSAASVMGSGVLAERFGYRQTVTASFLGSGGGMLMLLVMQWSPSYALLALFIPVFGFSMGMRGPIVSAICARHFAGSRLATIYGTIYATNALGGALGSFMGGLLHDTTGDYRAGLLFGLCFLAFAAAPFWTVGGLRHFR